MKEELSGIAAIVKTIPDQIKSIGDTLAAHVKDDDARLTKLEHAETTRKTRERLIWGGLTFLGAANLWALFKGAILTVVKGG